VSILPCSSPKREHGKIDAINHKGKKHIKKRLKRKRFQILQKKTCFASRWIAKQQTLAYDVDRSEQDTLEEIRSVFIKIVSLR
jgi:outer membrane protein assembly factor BamA